MFDNIAQLEKEIQEFQANILASKELLQCMNDLTEAVKRERETLAGSMTDLQTSVEQHTSDNTRKVSDSVNLLLESHKRAADGLATEVHTAVADLQKKSDADCSRLQTVVAGAIEAGEENLREISRKYDDFLEKLESSKLEHIYEYCSKLERSINQKFMLLGVGIIATAVLALISIIL